MLKLFSQGISLSPLRNLILSLSGALLLSFFNSPAFAQFEVPPLTAPVVDEANIIDQPVESALNNALRALRDSGGSQINVLTVPSLNGVPIEQASIQVTDKWQLGTKKGDNGALLLIAMQDRKMRIEVGQGLEGVIPDAIAKRIIEDRVAPLMREGRTSEAILTGVASIAEFSDPEFNFASYLNLPRAKRVSHERNFSWIWFLLFLFFIFLGPRGRRSGLTGALLGYGLGRSHGGWGGGGGFGSGGGGWSGGGGGFSGGGASGGW